MKNLGLAVVAMGLVVVGCASRRSGSVYSRSQAQKAQKVELGVVESVRSVEIEGTKSPVGPVAGGAVGGAAGSTVGGGSGRTVATVVGAVVGGILGAVVEEKVTKKDGLEITIKLDSGKLVAVTQESDVMFQAGERVRVLTGSDGTARVTK